MSPLLAGRSGARVTAGRGCVVSDISTHVCRRQTGPEANRPDREAKPHGRRVSLLLLFQSGEGFLRTITHAAGTSRPNRSAQLITARGGPFQIGAEKKFEMASLRAEACDFSSRLSGNAKRLRRSLVLDDMQPGATLFFHLFCRDYSAAKVGELRKLALDRLQAFMPSSVSDLGHCTIPDCPPKLVI